MPQRISFSIPGEPKAKDRHRTSARAYLDEGGKPQAIVSMHSTPEMVAAEKLIRDLFKVRFPRHQPWVGAVLIRFTAVFQTPASFNKALKAAANEGRLYCTKKPDKDNIEKLIVDSLNGVAWVDDAQVMGGGVKRYGSPPRIDVTLELLETPDVPATPGQKRAQARVDAGEDLTRAKPKRRDPTKSGNRSGFPPQLQARIDAAIERDARKPRK